MKSQSLIAITVFAVSFVSAFADRARIEALVLDEATGEPVRGVGVTATFSMMTKWHQINGGAVPNIVELKTDANGRCKASATTDAGRAGFYIQDPPSGYYRPLRGDGYDFTGMAT